MVSDFAKISPQNRYYVRYATRAYEKKICLWYSIDFLRRSLLNSEDNNTSSETPLQRKEDCMKSFLWLQDFFWIQFSLFPSETIVTKYQGVHWYKLRKNTFSLKAKLCK